MKLTDRRSYPLLLVLCYSMLGITFPAAVTQFSMVVMDVSEAMGVDSRTVLLSDSFRAVCLVAAMFLSGFMSKKLGLRRTMALGILFQIGSQFLIPTAVHAKSIPLLFLCKGLQGMNAMAFPLYISSITLWSPVRRRGLATAIFNGSFVAGGGIGAWLAGKVVPFLGWEISFYFIGAMCLIFAIPAMLLTRDKEKTAPVQEKMAPISEHATPIQKKVAAASRSKRGMAVYRPVLKNPATWMLVLSLIANTWVSQAINVDMSVYAQWAGYSYGSTGLLMLIISVVTVTASILAGGVSDWFAGRSAEPLRCRCFIMAQGNLLAAFASALLPLGASHSFILMVLSASVMMFGVSWANGVFWALPGEIYGPGDMIAGTAFCSGASNIPNPVAPLVVGVLLGANGLWNLGWMTCAVCCLLSFGASLLIRNPLVAAQAAEQAM